MKNLEKKLFKVESIQHVKQNQTTLDAFHFWPSILVNIILECGIMLSLELSRSVTG